MTEIKYSEALAELQEIVKSLQDKAIDVDDMVAKTRRAVELLNICRQRLTVTEEQLNQVLANLPQS